MIFSNLRHDNWWSRDNFSNQITDADEAVGQAKYPSI
jgi:hypothetical protein